MEEFLSLNLKAFAGHVSAKISNGIPVEISEEICRAVRKEIPGKCSEKKSLGRKKGDTIFERTSESGTVSA